MDIFLFYCNVPVFILSKSLTAPSITNSDLHVSFLCGGGERQCM